MSSLKPVSAGTCVAVCEPVVTGGIVVKTAVAEAVKVTLPVPEGVPTVVAVVVTEGVLVVVAVGVTH